MDRSFVSLKRQHTLLKKKKEIGWGSLTRLKEKRPEIK